LGEEEREMYAGFWKRFAAFWIDKVLLSVVILLIAYLLGIPREHAWVYSGIKSIQEYVGRAALKPAYIYLFVIVSPWLYHALFESIKKATPGKMLLGIEVVNLHGEKVTFWQATVRHFGKYISGLLLNIGFLMAAFTEKKQALHDILARTLVTLKLENET
jgi:uncharacterized RDD family membrane protein YckC